MTIYEQDTDPSTPSARRPAGSRATSTDPGVGPPSQGDVKATSVVVPAPAAREGHAIERTPVTVFASATRKKDSVELLLEGMSGPRPDRVKTMPRTSGEASAAYHAEHAVHPAHTSPDEQPKVMVDRDPVGDRHSTDPSGKVPALAEVPDGWGAADPTYVPAGSRARAIVLAILAGVFVVAGIAFSLDRRGPSATTESPATITVPSLPAPSAVAADEPAVAPMATTAPPVVEPLPVSSPASSPMPVTPIPTRPHTRASGPRAHGPPAAVDLGEFKTTF